MGIRRTIKDDFWTRRCRPLAAPPCSPLGAGSLRNQERQTTMELQPHQQRVVDEKTELDDKRTKLKAFIEGNAIFAGLPEEEKERLVRQHSCMTEYSEILGERIAAFTA